MAAITEGDINFESPTVVQHQTTGKTHGTFPSAILCDNGDILMAYRKDFNHLTTLTGDIITRRLPSGTSTWSAEAVVLNGTTDTDWDYRFPGLGRLADGTITLLVGRRTAGAEPNTDGCIYMTSNDNGATWGSPVVVTNTFTTFVRGGFNVVELPNGDLLAPLYGQDSDMILSVNSVRISKSTDGGATWSHLSEPADGEADTKRYTEPGMVILNNGQLACFVREDSGNEIYLTLSGDDGATWSALTKIANADGFCQPVQLADGRILMIQRYMDNPNAPEHQYARLLIGSADASSWRWAWLYEIGPNYPDIAQMTYGNVVQLGAVIHAIYGVEESNTAGDVLWSKSTTL